MGEFKVNLQYPFNPDYDYVSRLERINLDDERISNITNATGFIISEPKPINKDINDLNGIFSSKFGQTLKDINLFADRYKCECGALKSRIHHGITCHACNTKVKYVDDDFGYFGWIVIKEPYYVIHPNLYKSIDYLLGSIKRQSVLTNILKPVEKKNEDGYAIENVDTPKDEPFYGIGMMEFKERFLEIISYYATKNPNKKDYFNDIMDNLPNVFIRSIPVFTTHLRPFFLEGKTLSFGDVNKIYNLLSKLAASVNKDNLRIFKKKKSKNQLLFDIQDEYNKLYKEIESILAQKKGIIRSLFGGRYNFTSRSVIIPNPKLRVDEVTLPYLGLVELLQQRIINVLQKSHNITYSEAYKIWYKSQIKKDNRVHNIIEGLIKASHNGIPVLIALSLNIVI